uniref:Uncharacterized protein n=1 Tax=Rhizophora mucronata TaxID=61149 RepID=A0A2P2R2Q0_RHIMU
MLNSPWGCMRRWQYHFQMISPLS